MWFLAAVSGNEVIHPAKRGISVSSAGFRELASNCEAASFRVAPGVISITGFVLP
jgi:hypothetical protein